ncbi:ectoine/hydroxyectoine ABC transporter substrate-binding protein EhuB [Actinomycetes bacterium KLBMP 9759]
MTQRWNRRDFLRRSAFVGAAALAAPTVLSACTSTSTTTGSGGLLENARSAGTIKIGIGREAPYGYTDPTGKVTGESVEVARVVLKALGINEVQATDVDFGSLIPALNARQFDMVTAGMFINPERCANALFSDPDYTAPTAFLVPTGNPHAVRTFDEIKAKNLRLAVVSGAVEQGYAQKSGVPDAQIQVLENQNTLLQAITAGRADAAALTNISLNDVVKKNAGAPVEVTEGFFPVVDGKETISAGAFVFRKGDEAMVTAFNAELKKLHESGQWLTIAEPFGFSQDNVPKADVTTQRLCSGG